MNDNNLIGYNWTVIIIGFNFAEYSIICYA